MDRNLVLKIFLELILKIELKIQESSQVQINILQKKFLSTFDYHFQSIQIRLTA